MNKLKEFNDRLWLRLNKKPTGRMVFYITYMALPWMFVGFIVLGILSIIVAMTHEDVDASLLALPLVASLVAASVLVTLLVRVDNKRGYISAIHQQYLKQREEKINKIQSKSKKEV